MKNTISIKQLLRYPLKEVPLDGLWEIEHIIESFNLSLYSLSEEKLDKSLFKIRNIYDNPHKSDERSYRSLLFFRGEFCCLFGYTGDRGRSTIEFSSQEKAVELFSYLSLLQEIEFPVISEDEYDISDDYTTFCEEDGVFYYIIDNAKWSCSFGKNMNSDNMLYVDDSGNMHKAKFIKFKTDKMSWEENPEDKFILIELENNKQIEAPYYRVIFKV